MNEYTHECKTCKAASNDYGYIFKQGELDDADGFIFCDTCGSVLTPTNGEPFQMFAATVDTYIQKWIGKTISELDCADIPKDAPEKTTPLDYAISILNELRRDKFLREIARTTRIYADGQSAWEVGGGELEYFPATGMWRRKISYNLADSDSI